MEQNEKAMKMNINRAALCTLLFALFGGIIGPALELPYGKTVVLLLSAGLLLFMNRKYLPEKWPLQQKMPLTSFGVALGIFGGYHALIGLLSSGNTPDLYPDLSSVLCMGLITPLTEEIVFRGVVLNRLKNHGILFGVIASSILFGVYHMNVVQLITGGLLGLILAYVAMNYSIVYSFLLHFFNNMIMAICLPKLCESTGISSLKVIVGLVCLVVGIACAVTSKAWDKVVLFDRDNKGNSERGCYKAFFSNPLVILLLVFAVIITVVLLLMANNGAFSEYMVH